MTPQYQMRGHFDTPSSIFCCERGDTMPRQKPELYGIKGEGANITVDFIRAMAEGLLLALRELGILEDLP